jgi:hypothetical protein
VVADDLLSARSIPTIAFCVGIALPMNVLLLQWDTKPDKRISRTFPPPYIDTQNFSLCRIG